jgi:hypothetical protein
VFVDRCRNDVNTTAIDALLRREARSGAHDLGRLRGFAYDVAENRTRLRELLFGLRARGYRIAGVSAPAKGMTLLNYCGIGGDVLDFVTEKSRLKIGRYTPGGSIPVLSDDALIEQRPDYALLLAWNFSGEIMRNLGAYTAAGGRFILPIPAPRIITPARLTTRGSAQGEVAGAANEESIEEREAA